jgi:hypothetical protein
MASKDTGGGGLSATTLLIASLSSVAAAFVVHEFWQGGAILGAAVTPVIVAIVSEALRKPVDAVKARTGTTTVNPPPVVESPRPDDRFGIWEEQRRRPLHLKIALATGVAAFLIAAFFLTGAELVLGGASDSDRFRYVPGKQEERDRRDRDAQPATTQQEEADPAPDEEQEAQPTVTVTTPPEEEAPETAPEEVPPQETVPEPGATTPVQP